MKKFRIILFTVLIVMVSSFSVYAAETDIKVMILYKDMAFENKESKIVDVGSKEVVFTDQKPVIIDGRVFVPVRGVFELLVDNGDKSETFSVDWDNKTSTATIKNKWYNVKIKSGQDSFTSNGKTITPDVAPQIINDRLLLPLRAVAEAVDAKVEWDDKNNTAKIYYEPMIMVTPAG